MSQSATIEAVAVTPILKTVDIEDIECPPTDLWSDEPPLESDFHRDQIDLLIRILRWWWRERADVYISGNLTIYYNQEQLKTRDFRGPDFFVVLGAEKKERKSWVVWGENGLYPHFILEILSPSTKRVDKQLKKELYQTTFRTPDYFWFDPNTLEFQGFHLVDGNYQAIQPTEQGWLWSQQLELFLGIFGNKLRFFTAKGDLLPSSEELVEQERQRAEQERQRAELAEQEIARLKDQLRTQGLEPEAR